MTNNKISKLKNIIHLYTNTETMTNNKQQTAVEWLQSIELERDLTLADWKQAKEMEKERMKEAMHMQVKKYTTTYLDEDGNPQLSYDIQESFKDYWNETYGGGNK
jgi:hypothetical protein